jgi:hypothetical protein
VVRSCERAAAGRATTCHAIPLVRRNNLRATVPAAASINPAQEGSDAAAAESAHRDNAFAYSGRGSLSAY